MQKMSKLLKIAISIVILFAIAAPSCQEENAVTEEQQILDLKKDILDDFSSDYLTEEEKFAFEQKAVQLLSEIFDYLKTATDSTINDDFRRASAKMLKQSFISDQVIFSIYDLTGQEKFTVGSMISKALNNQLSYQEMDLRKIRVESPLQKTGEGEYAGKLTFFTFGKPDQLLAEFFVVKAIKSFGDESVQVWQVKFVEIKKGI
jgi:hypothetical protein